MQTIHCFHLLNDRSGSPKVLSQAINTFIEKGFRTYCHTSAGTTGFLSDIDGCIYKDNAYRYTSNKISLFFILIWSQCWTICSNWHLIKKNDIVYINTVLPFGAAILGRFKSCKVIYHVHETSIRPLLLKKFLFYLLRLCSDKIIYVSNYLKHAESKEGNCEVIYNAIPDSFLERAQQGLIYQRKRKNVLMLCSLKAYKGVHEYVTLAERCKEYNFRLVLNSSQDDIDQYFEPERIPSNLKLFPRQNDVHPFYKWADVVLNLSRPDAWVETFGLTAIEAMAYGLPVIVPPVGGISELVQNAHNGYKVDSRNSFELHEKLNKILGDKKHYEMLRTNCFEAIKKYKEDTFKDQIFKSCTTFQKLEFSKL